MFCNEFEQQVFGLKLTVVNAHQWVIPTLLEYIYIYIYHITAVSAVSPTLSQF